MLIFSVAIVKAFLVARHYMHLRQERAIIYAIALVPLVFVVIFLIGLFPDFVYHLTKP
jgi:caa(3)-type oxidase subunit IV